MEAFLEVLKADLADPAFAVFGAVTCMKAVGAICELIPAELAVIVVILRIGGFPRLMHQRQALQTLVRWEKAAIVLLIHPITPA